MKVLYFTNAGIRKKNEDSLLIHNRILSNISMDTCEEIELSQKTPLIFGIADGIGGRPGGEVASYLVLKDLKENKELLQKKDYLGILQKMHQSLNFEVKTKADLEGMGTTISSILVNNENVNVFHVGDTRIYAWNEQKLELITHDHTHVIDLVEKGFLKYEDVPFHPMRNYLKSAITTNIDVEKLEFQSITLPLEKKNFFLCSDGVWEVIPDKKLKQILTSPIELFKKGEKIIKQCIENKVKDNFSFIIIENSRK
ncbi:MAG: protein phosphatase 2C domain-containing protein [Leptospiraceae bacterium]|nr:protein phosphatase 2C domain-containing protein [Leptospiraceae bacterium]MDW7976115.1 protein phosphatase 2C domain-containing protein [Leptospiraceae bacterium]